MSPGRALRSLLVTLATASCVDTCTLTVSSVTPCGAASCPSVGPVLEFVRGSEVACPDASFGGWSGLTIAPSGHLLILSDRNGTFSLLPTTPKTGDTIEMRAMTLSMAAFDAEALTISADGSASFVSFELHGGVYKYANVLSGAGTQLATASANMVSDCDGANAQYEVLELISNGTLLGICQGNGKARLIDTLTDTSARAFTYRASADLEPADAAILPNGAGLLVLERIWRGSSKPPGQQTDIKVMYLTLEMVNGDAPMAPLELLSLQSSVDTADNFEGIAVKQEPGGSSALVWIISDDNFHRGSQRTLLYTFRLPYSSLITGLTTPISPASDAIPAAQGGLTCAVAGAEGCYAQK